MKTVFKFMKFSSSSTAGKTGNTFIVLLWDMVTRMIISCTDQAPALRTLNSVSGMNNYHRPIIQVITNASGSRWLSVSRLSYLTSHTFHVSKGFVQDQIIRSFKIRMAYSLLARSVHAWLIPKAIFWSCKFLLPLQQLMTEWIRCDAVYVPGIFTSHTRIIIIFLSLVLYSQRRRN